jgi:thiosulfate dehydrogenase
MLAILCALWVGGLLIAPLSAPAQEAYEDEDVDIWAIARGGQLYDSWPLVLDTEAPKTTHPAYPPAGKAKGPATWRCKECHGWDYKGEDGAYGKGRHYSGVKGLRRMVGVDPEEIEKIIMNETHAYTPEMIPPAAVKKLALFVSKGQIDMDQYIEHETKKARGDLDRGALFYQTVCALCHGFDGARITFHREETALTPFEDPGYMGTLANRDPWEVLHKIRNGQPGVGMVALRTMSIQDQVDVLAYVQTLPRTKPRRNRR